MDLSALRPGQRLGRFTIHRERDSGATSVVYEATDATGAPVALKVLRAMHHGDEEILKRFVNEAEPILREQLVHPGLPRVLSISLIAEEPRHIVMELLGASLAGRLEEGPLPLTEALDIAAQLADVLSYLHGRGIIHRDLKPANVLATGPGWAGPIKLVDLGQAKLPSGRFAAYPLSTSAGGRCGTATYRAPEQWLCAKTVSDRADIYSLGVILYEMITGAPPFRGSSGQIRLGHVLRPPPSLAGPPVLADLYQAMLRKEPPARPAAATVTAALRAIRAVR